MENIIFTSFFILVPAIIVLRFSLMRDALRYFKLIKLKRPSQYQDILGTQKISWIERGYHTPFDIGIQIRLYKSLYKENEGNIFPINVQKRIKFKLQVLFFLILLLLAMTMFFLFLIQSNLKDKL